MSTINSQSMFPDRTIYKLAHGYNHVYPYAYALMTGLNTPGSRADKVDAGMDDLVYWLSYRGFAKLYNKGLAWLYEHHPGLAEYVNRHPILTGAPTMMAGAIVSSMGAGLLKRLFQVAKSPFKDQIKMAVDHPMANTVSTFTKPVTRFLTTPAFRKYGGLAVLGFLGVYFVTVLKDAWHFGHVYKKARALDKTDSPYGLKNQVLSWDEDENPFRRIRSTSSKSTPEMATVL